MSILKVVAQNCMDFFYKQYKSEEDFFELYHFKYLITIGYYSLLQKEYEDSYAMNLRENGIGEASINPEWFIQQEIEVKPSDNIGAYVGQLKCQPVQFRFDKQSSGIRDIVPLNGHCKTFIKTSFDEKWKFELLPPSPEIYWFPLGDKIYFSHVKCGMSKALALIIPTVTAEDDNAVIPQGIESDVVNATLNFMFAAMQGKQIVDVTQDGNPNAAMATEINNIFTKYKGAQ